jgi:hypothetical protein
MHTEQAHEPQQMPPVEQQTPAAPAEVNEHAHKWHDDAATGASELMHDGWRAVILPEGSHWNAYVERADGSVEERSIIPELAESHARARAWCEMELGRLAAMSRAHK